MCFSAEVSFISSAVLAVAGGLCIIKSLRAKKDHFLLSLTPFIFAIQQFTEGIVWVGVNYNNEFLTRTASIWYLFFAFYFWLVWFPMIAYSTEHIKWKRKFFLWLIGVGFTFGLYLWLPVLFGNGPRKLIETEVCGHGLCYNVAGGGYLPGIVREYIYAVLGLLYLSCSDGLFKKFWMIVMFSAAITLAIHVYATASVWCFFSAIASLYIFFLIKERPNNETAALFIP